MTGRVIILLSSLVFLLSSFVISHGIKNIGTKNENYITVKGLSEREVISNSSSWNLQYELVGNTVDEINRLNNANLMAVKEFFVSYGFNEDDSKD